MVVTANIGIAGPAIVYHVGCAVPHAVNAFSWELMGLFATVGADRVYGGLRIMLIRHWQGTLCPSAQSASLPALRPGANRWDSLANRSSGSCSR